MMQSVLTLGQVCQGVECLVKDHNQKQYNKIMEICMKKGCTQANILCPLCKNLHNDHREQLVSIPEIEDAYVKSKKAQQDKQNMLLLLIYEFQQFARNQLDVMIKNMRQMINSFNNLESIIMKNKQQSYHQLKGQVSELVKQIEFDNFKVDFKQFNSQQIDDQINNLANKYLQEIKDFMQQKGILRQVMQLQNFKSVQLQQDHISYQLQQQQNNFSFGLQAPKVSDLHFTQQLCGINIKCIRPNCVKNIYAEVFLSKPQQVDLFIFDAANMACLDRILQKDKVESVVFKINCLYSNIGIGVLQMNKGTYQVNSKGQIFNKDEKDYIKQDKYFKMVEGEKYRLTFNPASQEKKQFTLEQVENQQQQANKIVMPMKIDKSSDYQIFVYLPGFGSEIELINE